MIMGDPARGHCAFCNVKTDLPAPSDPHEPENRIAVAKLGSEHVVITSVDRDDLADGGAEHFAQVIRAIRGMCRYDIEVLTPDFCAKEGALEIVGRGASRRLQPQPRTVASKYLKVRGRGYSIRCGSAEVRKLDPDHSSPSRASWSALAKSARSAADMTTCAPRGRFHHNRPVPGAFAQSITGISSTSRPTSSRPIDHRLDQGLPDVRPRP